ncbi:uncharacterized protein CXorf49 homolog isoform X2 [Tamandua tetradactyla]|uniref:uncharacterized protein CXorf49 homolog isoform X2 n=1 Tax=Tamandua tetradactyla TaxID=48850 RepID=UPI004053889A
MSSPEDKESPTSPDPPLFDFELDEPPEMALMRMYGLPEEAGPLEDAGAAAEKGDPSGPVPLQASTPHSVTSSMEKQPSGELEASTTEMAPAKEMESVVGGKSGGKRSYPDEATPGLNGCQETKAITASEVVLEQKSQENLLGGPLGPGIGPSVSNASGLGKADKSALGAPGPKRYKLISIKKSLRGPELVAQKDNANKDADPKDQLPANKSGLPFVSVIHGGQNDGDPKTRGSQISGNSVVLFVAKKGVKGEIPLPGGGQGAVVYLPKKEKEQPLPVVHCCPQCFLLQKEVEHLKDQLASIQHLMNKYHMF